MARMFPIIHDRVSAGENIDQRGNLVSQLILGYCCRVSFILNVLLVLGTEVKGVHVNGNFLNCSGKLVVPFFIIVRYRCLIIHAYVNPFIARKCIGLRLWDFPFSDFLPIDIQNGLPTGSWLTAIKYKLVLKSMFSGGNRFGRSNVGVFKSKKVIFVMQLAAFHVKGPPAKATGLGNDNSIRISVRQFDVGCYTKRAVLYIDKGILRYAVHA